MVQYFFKCTQFTIHNVKVPYHALHYTYQSLTRTVTVYSIFLRPPLQSQLYCICICICILYLQFVFTIVNTICIACCFSSRHTRNRIFAFHVTINNRISYHGICINTTIPYSTCNARVYDTVALWVTAFQKICAILRNKPFLHAHTQT